jgi:hypothetical protein
MPGLLILVSGYGVKRLLVFMPVRSSEVSDQNAYLSPSPALKELIRGGFSTSSQELILFVHNVKIRNMKLGILR